MARVVVAMSGGVDSSVAALLAREAGHDVIGVTLRLTEAVGDRGCCSLGDVEDARSVAALLGVRHVVADLRAEFNRAVVEPYLEAHRRGWTPNPCMACNRYVKVTALVAWAKRLGASRLVTGHYATVVPGAQPMLARGRDRHKDQSYVLADVPSSVLSHLWLPLGELSKDEVRARAREAGLPVWDKRDSQDVCFTPRGRAAFVAEAVGLTEVPVRDAEGGSVGVTVPFELVTVGQRLREPGRSGSSPRYVIAKSRSGVRVGAAHELLVGTQPIEDLVSYVSRSGPLRGMLQTGAHALPIAGSLSEERVAFDELARRVAPGQRVVLYDAKERVLASARVVDDA